MPDLLLHSMAELSEIILPSLELAGATRLVEVGAEGGQMTQRLLAYTAKRGGTLTSIDTSPSERADALFAGQPHARLLRATSLEALPQCDADAWLIDGDHNYYTVLAESEAIWERCAASGTPFFAIYHDVGWPCARRDFYYAPDRLPRHAVHPHAWDRGTLPGTTGTVAGGFRGEGQWALALHEGGPRNGVLTAIEDFTAGKEDRLLWAMVPAVFGLGVLFDAGAPWAEALIAHLLPYHQNPVLARLEANRLACYLRVIDWQDRTHDEAA